MKCKARGTQWMIVGSLLAALAGCGGGQKKSPAGSSKTASGTGSSAAKEKDKTTSTAAKTKSAAKTPEPGGWGDLVGRFVVEGNVPEPEKLEITKDVAICAKHQLVDESVVVGEGGGLANVLVYLRDEVEPHADYESMPDVVIDNKNCRFEPRVSYKSTAQKLVLKNSDPVGHNTKCDPFRNPAFNVLIPSGESLSPDTPLERAESFPAPVGCNIHPWMSGFLMVGDTPYGTVSAKDGTFKIEKLPTGTYEFQFWQEKIGNLADTKVGQSSTSDRGRVKLAINPGTNDLGEITIPASILKD